VGVKQSTSDLLTANCDEFIFYDDLVRESARVDARRNTRNNQPAVKRTPEEEQRRRAELDARRTKAVEMALETYEALVTDRDEGGKIWASVLKEAIKRRNPGFNENYYGFRTFGNLLEEAKARGLLEFGRDEKSSAFVFRGTGLVALPEAVSPEALAEDLAENGHAELVASTDTSDEGSAPAQESIVAEREPRGEASRTGTREGEGRGRRRGRGRDRDRERGEAVDGARNASRESAPAPTPAQETPQAATPAASSSAPAQEAHQAAEPALSTPEQAPSATETGEARRRSRGGRGGTTTRRSKADAATAEAPSAAAPEPAPVVTDASAARAEAPDTAAPPKAAPAAKKARRAPAKKAASRARKASASNEEA